MFIVVIIIGDDKYYLHDEKYNYGEKLMVKPKPWMTIEIEGNVFCNAKTDPHLAKLFFNKNCADLAIELLVKSRNVRELLLSKSECESSEKSYRKFYTLELVPKEN